MRSLVPFIALSAWGATVLCPSITHAEVPLDHAVIASLRNAVELILQNQAPRSANVRDTLVPGDALSTASAARAELRFNDGSLARVGGQALFRFISGTRTLALSNGTVLLLVPPGRGQTQIQTPNATTNIHGSALFVRYLPSTDVTLIGALTDGGIEITNRERSQTQALGAGQIAVVTNNHIEQVYGFDLKTFYETSELAKGLDLQRSAPSDRADASTDQAIAAVRAETSAAARTQAKLGTANETTAATGQPPTPTATATQETQTTSPTALPSGQPTAASSTIALPADRLLTTPTVGLPTTVPPTLALPTNVPANPAASALPPSLTDLPGLTGMPPGLAGTPPGQGSLPPGQTP